MTAQIFRVLALYMIDNAIHVIKNQVLLGCTQRALPLRSMVSVEVRLPIFSRLENEMGGWAFSSNASVWIQVFYHMFSIMSAIMNCVGLSIEYSLLPLFWHRKFLVEQRLATARAAKHSSTGGIWRHRREICLGSDEGNS